MEELWIDVPNYKGRYQVSNKGRLKSIIKSRVRILKGSLHVDGYTSYTLNYKEFGLYNVYLAHQLVAIAWLGHEPNGCVGYVVDHIDNNPSNNCVSNLQLLSNFRNTTKGKKCSYGATKNGNKYNSVVYHSGKNIYLGYFNTEEEATKRAKQYLKDNNIKRITS